MGMSGTERLRRLLDERGVEWMPVAWNPKRETFYHAANGVGFCADEYTDGVRIYTDATITPEQAIDATLGRGTCQDLGGTDENGQQVFNCSKCGCMLSLYYRDGINTMCTHFICDYPRYCPECGAEVVDDG
jgi:hypothetical protein